MATEICTMYLFKGKKKNTRALKRVVVPLYSSNYNFVDLDII